MLMGSLRSSYPELIPQLMANTNPGGPGHRWVKEYWIKISEAKRCEACRGEGCEECEGIGSVRTGRIVSSAGVPYVDPISGYSRIFIPSLARDNPFLNESYHQYLNSLPPALRAAWRDGDWDVFEGQFFDCIGLRGKPWEIGRERAQGRLFGSLDIGISHFTSFGLWYLDSKGGIHRLFTYKANGGTHRGHAEAIRDRIEGFRWTQGVMPVRVWYGKDAETRTKVREDMVFSPLDEYKDVFKDIGGLTWTRANDDRESGCGVMRECYSEAKGVPRVTYWADYNKTYEEDMQAMMVNENHPETYLKVDGDDTPDEVRYGLMGLYSFQAQEFRAMEYKKQRSRYHETAQEPEKEYAGMLSDTTMG